MTVNIKFGKVLKDQPGLNTQAEPHPAEDGDPQARHQFAQPEPPIPYDIKFPLWFKQNQQRLVLEAVEDKLADLETQWQSLALPEDNVVWVDKSQLDEQDGQVNPATEPSALPGVAKAHAWPQIGGQITSAPQNPEAPVPLKSDSYLLKLRVDSREYDISIAVSQKYGQVDNNRELLHRLAVAINSGQPEVRARLEEDMNPNNPMMPYRLPGRSLKLVVDGHGHSFALCDMEGSLLQTYGFNKPGGNAGNRNGLCPESADGLNSLDEMVGVISRANDDDGFELAITSGPKEVLEKVSHFLQSYNALIDYISSQSDYLRPSLQDRLIRPQEDRKGPLSALGLDVDYRGRIIPLPAFSDHLLTNYPTTSNLLITGESAWAPALLRQIVEIRKIGLNEYADALVMRGDEQARSRAWWDLENLREKIISAYY